MAKVADVFVKGSNDGKGLIRRPFAEFKELKSMTTKATLPSGFRVGRSLNTANTSPLCAGLLSAVKQEITKIFIL